MTRDAQKTQKTRAKTSTFRNKITKTHKTTKQNQTHRFLPLRRYFGDEDNVTITKTYTRKHTQNTHKTHAKTLTTTLQVVARN